MATAVVGNAMNGYQSACAEKNWFYQLALGNAFASAVWELLQARGRPRVHFKDVQEFVIQEFESHLDRTLLTKAMWDATQNTFKDNDTVSGKVFRAVSNSYHTVLDELLADSRPLEDAEKVERFIKRWIEASMHRAWTSVENSEVVLTPGNVSRLFQNLVAPFGEAHEYSCIPIMFIEHIGRPPRNWQFLRVTVQQLFKSWKQDSQNPPSTKRRKKSEGSFAIDEDSAPAIDGEDPLSAAEVDATSMDAAGMHAKQEVDLPDADFVEEAVKQEEEDAADDLIGNGACTGHPECTSEEDCIGNDSDFLVRHMLAGDAGDVYCMTCWESFLTKNTMLEGMWEDGDQAGTMYNCT
ncbi:unnamed protein product [Polarella glacialis]|uniref:Uncharacterized protein n=1 Tax=Polarella glacialis TaxID=89957 RepID=A0A813M8R2_POLGL|nr:unnamed protein product [Polarella glacialis]